MIKRNRWYEFDTAAPLIEYLQEAKTLLAGKQLTALYNAEWRGTTEGPVVLCFGEVCLVICSMRISTADIAMMDTTQFQKDPVLNSLPCAVDSPYLHQVLSDISVSRFSEAHEIDPETDEMRPAGGDYFSTVSFTFRSGSELSVCGCSVADDGYMFVDVEERPRDS